MDSWFDGGFKKGGMAGCLGWRLLVLECYCISVYVFGLVGGCAIGVGV